MKVGDLVKVEGGTLRPEWYGKVGIITSLEVPILYLLTANTYYEVALPDYGKKMIRDDMLRLIDENR